MPEVRLWQDRRDMEGGVGWWRQIEEALKCVEFLVIVMTPGALISDVTRKEWRAARQAGVCVFPVKGPGFDFDNPQVPGWMKRTHIYDLDVQWATFVAHLQRGCQTTRVPFMAPPLPSGFVARPDQSAAVRSMLFDQTSGDAVAITTALAGAGGFGKTTLAAALCHEDEIVSAFDDGILWATLGQNPNIQSELTRLYAALTGDRPGFFSPEDAAQALAEQLEHKRCLIVVDDVWDPAHLRHFLRGGPTSPRLVTTRQMQVAAEGKHVTVDEMRSDEAASLLIARLGHSPDDLQPFRRLARRLGEWPLLLRLAAAALRQRLERGDTLAGALRYVDRALDKRGVIAFDRERAADRNEAVRSTLGMSLDLLAAADRLRCVELAIFPQDAPIPAAVAAELWGLDDLDGEDVLSRLHDASLLEFDIGTGLARIHDVMRACFAVELGAKAAITHARLLNAWPNTHRLPHPYAWRWLAHHLTGAGRAAELPSLLLDFDWLQLKLDATDIYALLADFRHAPDDSRIALLHNVLRLSSHVLAKDKSQLPAQVMGRAPDLGRELKGDLWGHEKAARRAWIRPVTASLIGPGGALVRTLDCHAVPTSVAVTPDGKWIVSGTSDGAVSVWDFNSGTRVRTLGASPSSHIAAPDEPGATFALMPDGQLLLARAGHLAIWDPATGAEPLRVANVKEPIACLAVSGDGRRALAGSKKGDLTLFDTTSGDILMELAAHRVGVAAVALTADGALGVSGSYDRTVRVWDLTSYTLINTLFPNHEGTVYSVALSTDGRVALSGGGDRTVRVWDVTSQTCRATLSGHSHRVYDIALSRDGRRAISGSHDRTVKLWDVPSGTAISTLHGHADSVVAVALASDERHAVSAAKDGTVRVWQLDAAETRASTQEHEGWIHAVAITPDGSAAVTGGQDHTVRVWHTASGQMVHALTGHQDAVTALAIHRDGSFALSGSLDRTVMVWDLAAGRPLRALKGNADGIAALAVSPDGKQALSGALDGDVIVWDLLSWRIVRRWDAHRRDITFLVVLPWWHWGRAGYSERRRRGVPARAAWDASKAAAGAWQGVVTGSMDGTLKLWDLETSACVHTINAHVDGVTAGAISPDGRLLLSGGLDGTLRLWRFPSGELLASVPAHAARIRTICISAGGELAMSGSYDRSFRIWSVPDLNPRAAFAADSAISAAAASDTGDLIVAGDAQGCAHFLYFERA